MTTTRLLSRVLLLGFLALQAGVAFAWDANKILQVRAEALPTLDGQRIEALRVAVWRDGALQPIPFQVDEYSEVGLPWFRETGLALRGQEGLFDGDDRLLLLAGDAGPDQLPEGTPVPPGYLGELTVRIQGETRYVHLITGDFPKSPVSYMRHDVATGITETPFYTLRVDPRNELNWQYLMVRSWRGDREQSIVDTLKMRIAGGVFTPITRLTLDNDNLRPKIIGVRSGPIRSAMQLETSVVVSGVTVMKMQVQVIRYPRYFEAYTHARIPKLYRMALRDPEVSVTVDGNNLVGAMVRTARGGTLQAIVDGALSPNDRELIRRGLSSDDDWVLFDSRNGFSMLTFLDVPKDLRGVPLKLIFDDAPERHDKPERYPGQFPNVGYGIRGFPPGEDFRFGVTLAFDKDLGTVDARSYVTRWRESPEFRFRAAGR